MSIIHHTQTTRLPNLIPPYQIVFPGYMRALHSAATDMLVSRDGVGLNGFICTPAEYQALNSKIIMTLSTKILYYVQK